MQTQTTIITITAILCVTVLMTFAIFEGLDGTLLASAFAIIGGLAGYHLKDTIAAKIHPAAKTEKTDPPPKP